MPCKTFISIIVLSAFLSSFANGQDVYKTPNGKRYHLSTCRMVENVSTQLMNQQEISDYNLTPCKICKPPNKYALYSSSGSTNKAVGTAESVQCKGTTQKGTRCKHRTKLSNGYCYQHTKQQNSIINRLYNSISNTQYRFTTCGAKNKTGGYCKRKVKSGKCYQHQ